MSEPDTKTFNAQLSGGPAVAPSAEIVVIDDDAAVRDTLVTMSRRLGFNTIGVDPNSDIVGSVDVIGPSVIILDLSLGRRDAVQVLHALADRGCVARILLVSGRDADTLERVKAIGVRCGLQMLAPLGKPVSGKDLKASLSAVLLPDRAETPLVLFDLEEGIRKRWLELWYQPKVMLKTRTMRGAEALIRLRHPELGVVPPASFIPSANVDTYEAMTGFVVETVARDMSILKSQGLDMPISINASISMIQRPAFLDMIRGAWPDSSKRPRLVVEVTEDDLITDLPLAQEIATQLKLYDVDISIDDFGAGYSSFARLRDLPFTEIKLDKSFVIGCGADDKQLAFCDATAALARQFQIQSVAEGIETADDLAAIERAGFDFGQGYYFARPKPLGEFIELVAKLRSRQRRKKLTSSI